MTAIEPGAVRSLLLGVGGPVVDPHEVVDALDVLGVVIRESRSDGSARVQQLVDALLGLTRDDDVLVATGAALGLHQVRDLVPVATLCSLVGELPPDLLRSPSGFTAVRFDTLAAEVAHVAASAAATQCRRIGRADWETSVVSLLDEPPPGTSSAALAAELVAGAPGLVVEHAARWCAGDTGAVLARCPDGSHRLALAAACRPWTDAAVVAVRQAAQWQRWPDADLRALIETMTGD